MTTTDQSPNLDGPNHGAVRLLLDMPPWRIVLSMRSLRRTAQNLETLLQTSDDELLSTADLAQELRKGVSYRLQMEFDEVNLSEPFVTAELIEKRQTRSGLELEFSMNQQEATAEPKFQF